jgi:BirA family biotin operon repressor/biotin-[acetyl-CoA-carboxylase] ligase
VTAGPPPLEVANELDPPTLGARLSTRWMGRRHLHVATCTSTNDLAAAEARTGAPAGTLVTADEQTAGRGRLGRTWHAAPGENLTFSFVLRPGRPAPEIPTLTLLAGAAVAQALAELGFSARLKWPNDVLLRVNEGGAGRARKVAGILTEAATVGSEVSHVVVGIGLNVNVADFPSDLAARATSLRLVRGTPLPRGDVLACLLARLEAAADDFQQRGPEAATALWDAYADRELRCRARLDGHDVEGVPDGVSADGSLRLRDDDGIIHRVMSGEIVAVLE